MAPTNRVLEALAVEALRHTPELVAFVGRIANALETIADAQAFQALKAYGDSLYPTAADAPDEARALQAARVIAGRGAARIGKRLAIRAGAGTSPDTAEHPENDAPARRARRPAR